MIIIYNYEMQVYIASFIKKHQMLDISGYYFLDSFLVFMMRI